ncbi:MAG: Crp/Fnr family transcriptional regulator [Chloroflexi bacterium]|nr:Crp/Fnr family transcriptional regulator [Chloroflexota bacterium]
MKEIVNPIPNEQFPELFAQLPREDPAFGRAIRIRRVHPDDSAAAPEEMSDHLYILIEGYIQLMIIEKDGRSVAIGGLPAGAVFGGEALYHLQPNEKLYTQAVEPCTLWELSAEHAQLFIERHPIIALGLLRTLGRRLAQVENRLEEVAYRRLPERLAAELLRQHRRAQNREVRISHQALAEILGTYRETISAILRDFKREGWVQLGYRRIIVQNPTALANLAGPVYE